VARRMTKARLLRPLLVAGVLAAMLVLFSLVKPHPSLPAAPTDVRCGSSLMQPRDACEYYNVRANGTRVAGGVLRDYEEAREDPKNEWQEEVDDVLSSDRSTRTVSRNLAVAVLCIGAAVTLLRVVVMFSIHALRSRRATSPNDV
jgi:hypothetical protein